MGFLKKEQIMKYKQIKWEGGSAFLNNIEVFFVTLEDPSGHCLINNYLPFGRQSYLCKGRKVAIKKANGLYKSFINSIIQTKS